jgi:hypothetical protein
MLLLAALAVFTYYTAWVIVSVSAAGAGVQSRRRRATQRRSGVGAPAGGTAAWCHQGCIRQRHGGVGARRDARQRAAAAAGGGIGATLDRCSARSRRDSDRTRRAVPAAARCARR